MNRREKILASCIGGLIGVFALGFGVRGFVLAPIKTIDRNAAVVRDKLDKLAKDRRAFFDAEDRMKSWALTTFADTVDQASAKSGEMLTKLILKSGLPEEDFTRLPVGPRKLLGAAAQEIGWNVQGDGKLTDVIDLVYLLQMSPYLSRIEGLSIKAGDAPGYVRVSFRFLTLVIDSAPDVKRKELIAKYALESPERHIFDGIVSRDLLRPYIKRPPPPSAPPSTPGTSPGNLAQNGGKPAAPPGPESFRVVSLSEWMGEPEIHVRDLSVQKTTRYKAGDPLAGGKIVCVDYRPMPMPGNELLRSDSRVIVKIGGDYFAIERGRTLADKRKLTPEQLPSGIAKAK